MIRVRTWRILSTSRLGRRGSILLTIGVFCVVYGASQIWPNEEWLSRSETIWRSRIMPPDAWGILWCAIGALCLFSAFLKQDRVGYSASTALLIFWSLTSAAAQIWGSASRGYVSATTWGCFAVMIMIFSGIREQAKVETFTTIEEDGSTTAFPVESGDDHAL